MKKKVLSLLLAVIMSLCLLPAQSGSAYAAGTKKALIYQYSVSSDSTITDSSKRIANRVRTCLRQLGYTCDTVYCGGQASPGTSAVSELCRMARYDLVFFTCHGIGSSVEAGKIHLYENVYITADSMDSWGGTLSKNKLIFVACCSAGRCINGACSVCDMFRNRGAKFVVCYTDFLGVDIAYDTAKFFFEQYARTGIDTKAAMKSYFDFMRDSMAAKYPNRPLTIRALRCIY